MKVRRKPGPIVEAVQWWPPGDPRHVPIEGVFGRDGRWFFDDGTLLNPLVPGKWIVGGEEVATYLDRYYEPADQPDAAQQAAKVREELRELAKLRSDKWEEEYYELRRRVENIGAIVNDDTKWPGGGA